MSKTYSSFENQHMLFENWRRYTTEPDLLTEAEQSGGKELLAALSELRENPNFFEALEMVTTGATAPQQPLKQAAEGKIRQPLNEVVLGIPYFVETINDVLEKIKTNPFVYENWPKLGEQAARASNNLLKWRKSAEVAYETALAQAPGQKALNTMKWITKVLFNTPYLRNITLFFTDPGWDKTAAAISRITWATDIGLRGIQMAIKKRDPDDAENWLRQLWQIDAKMAAEFQASDWWSLEVGEKWTAAKEKEWHDRVDTRGRIEKYGEKSLLRHKDKETMKRISQDPDPEKEK
jgi:hypothetical protein